MSGSLRIDPAYLLAKAVMELDKEWYEITYKIDENVERAKGWERIVVLAQEVLNGE